MPYIITTTTPDAVVPAHEVRGSDIDLQAYAVTRRAVATLAEVVSALNATGADWTLDGANGESGGTIGPLPDGSVIEVTRVQYLHLVIEGPASPRPLSHAGIIDAYNAAQA